VSRLSYKTLFLILVFLLIPIVLLVRINQQAKVASAGWWDDGWHYRQAINIGNTASAITNIQIKVLSSSDLSALVTAGKLQASLNDLRFTDVNGKLINYLIEDSTNNSVDVWGVVPSIPTGGATIYMYYGNPSATSASSTQNITIGGTMTSVGGYRIHTFLGSGTFTSGTSRNIEVLVVAGGGGGGNGNGFGYEGGGGGAGGLIYNSSFTITPQAYTVTVGGSVPSATNGNNSVFSTLTAIGGGQGASAPSAGSAGGSGGGGTHTGTGGGSGVVGQGYSGGTGASSRGGGGGGAGSIGGTTGVGGTGLSYSISGSATYYAGGGGAYNGVTGGLGGGGNSTTTLYAAVGSGTANTGGGGAGAYSPSGNGGGGGSGIVIIRYSFITAGSPATEEVSKAPVAYWKFDEGVGTSANDSTSSKNNGFLNGATWQTEDQCISGKCLMFDGSNDYLDTNSTFPSLTNNFTISFWVKPGSSQVQYADIFGNHGGSYTGMVLQQSSATINRFEFGWGNGTSWASSPDSSYFNLTANTWQFVTIAKTSTGGTNIYVNGVYVTNKPDNSSIAPHPSYTLKIAQGFDGGGRYFNGFIDEFKIYPYIRSPAEIKNDYNAGKGHAGTSKGSSVNLGTNPKSSEAFSDGLVGYWKMDEGVGTTILDFSGNSNTATLGMGDSAPGWSTGKYGVGTSFDGSNDYATIPSSTTWNFSDMTVSSWIYVTAGQNTGNTNIVRKDNVNEGGTRYIFALLSSSTSNNDKPNFGVYDNGISNNAKSPTALTTGWHHIVGTRNAGTSIKLYVDGQLVDNVADPTSGVQGGTTNLTLGGVKNSVFPLSEKFTGKLDEVRIYNRALSPAEVKQLYEWAPGPKLYYNFDEGSGTNVQDSSGNGTVGSWNGTGTSHYGLGKYGKAANFNGSDDFVSIPNYAMPPTGTIEYWAISNTPTWNDNGLPISKRGDFIIHSNISSTGIGLYSNSTAYIGQVNPTVPITQWNHYAWTLSGSQSLFYINGILVSTINTSNLWGTSTDTLYIGRDSWLARYFNGKVDEFKIYNYALTQKQIVSDMNAGHPAVGSPIGSAIAHWKFDEGQGTTANNSGNGGSTLNGTITGATWTQNGKFGKALSFDGSDYVKNAGNNTGMSGDFSGTISAWVFPTNVSASVKQVAGLLNVVPGSSAFSILLDNNGAGSVGAHFNACGQNTVAGVLQNNNWYHLVITKTPGTVSSTTKIYVNGREYPTTNQYANCTPALSVERIEIGAGWNGVDGDIPFSGLIDDVKIYNYALTSDEVKTDYNQGKVIVMGSLSSGTGNTAPSGSASQAYCIPGDTTACLPPVAEWNFEENVGTTAYDTSGNANHGVFGAGNSAPTWSAGHQNSGAGLKFDGVDDYVEVGSGASLNITDAITIEAWVKPIDKGNYEIVFSKVGGVAHATLSRNYALFYVGGVYNWVITLSTNLYDGNWHHVVWIYDKNGGNNNMKFIVDGGKEVQSTTQTGSITTSGWPAGIGWAQQNSVDYFFKGQIDQVRVFNYARTPAQIAWDYNRGGPVAWYKLDECQGSVVHNSAANPATAGLDGTLVVGANGTQNTPGTCAIGTSAAWTNGATGKNNASLNFDGTDDYIGINAISGLTSVHTTSLWIKPTTITNGNYYIFDTGTVNNNWIQLYDGDGDGKLELRSGSIASGGYISYSNFEFTQASNWYHVVVTTDDTKLITIYINGIFDKSQTLTDVQTPGAIKTGVAGNDTCYFPGQIDDVQIYNYALTATQVKTLYSGGSVNFR